MIEGMGWLMDLCPQPEVVTLGNWLKPFGILPSQVKDPTDWEFLANYASLTALSRNLDAWNAKVKNPRLEISMSQDLVQYMLALREEARERYG
jgi:hypothetical protein